MPRDLLEAFSEYLYAELRYLRQVAAPGYSIDRKSAFQEAIQKLLLRMDDLLVEEESHAHTALSQFVCESSDNGNSTTE